MWYSLADRCFSSACYSTAAKCCELTSCFVAVPHLPWPSPPCMGSGSKTIFVVCAIVVQPWYGQMPISKQLVSRSAIRSPIFGFWEKMTLYISCMAPFSFCLEDMRNAMVPLPLEKPRSREKPRCGGVASSSVVSSNVKYFAINGEAGVCIPFHEHLDGCDCLLGWCEGDETRRTNADLRRKISRVFT